MTSTPKAHTFLIHYGELGLKGKNRKDFERKLKQNIEDNISKITPDATVSLKHRYLHLETSETVSEKKVADIIRSTFGISWFAKAETLPPDAPIEDISKIIIKLAKPHADPDLTFSIDVKRANKKYPMISPEIEKKLSEKVKSETSFSKFRYKDPDHTLHVEIDQEAIYIFDEKHRGSGGLPVGSSGRVLVLLSGGFDSPVSAYYAAKRGCAVDFLHFYAEEPKEESKLTLLATQLSKYTGPGNLHLTPYLPFYMAVSDINTNYELVLFRRFMLRVAKHLCSTHKYNAIVTGDSLGQVASQTIENLTATNDALENTLCIRPLIGFDKEEIIQVAKDIGTYDISIEEDKDCCSIIDKHAKTRVTLEKIRQEEKKLENYKTLLEETTSQTSGIKINS